MTANIVETGEPSTQSRRRPPSASGEFVNFVAVGKTFDGETNVVDGLDLHVEEGEFLTFLGPSGSGKTTTLLLLAGFETPTRGDILVRGKSITDTPPHRRNFGMVFQNYALFPHMTVQENVAFPLIVRGTNKSEAAARALKALDLVQLEQFSARRPSQLSGGQQQRAALARALVFDPVLVLMDEPFGALDKRLRETMQMEVKQIHARLGNSMISVTHDQSEALTMSDRIAVFNKGALQQVASPAEIYERPRNEFVARFVGDINMLAGTVETVSGDECAIRHADGTSTIVKGAQDARAGAKAALCIRPEKLSIDPSREHADNRIDGRIVDAVYWGDHVRLHIELADGTPWIAKAIRKFGATDLSVGAPIQLGWSKRDAWLLSS